MTVLLIDDSIMFSEGLQQLLTHNALIKKILLAHNYDNTFKILMSTNIDLVILDLSFEVSDYDGFKIAKKIKTLYPFIKIIILTQHAKIDHYELLVNNYKVNGYLDKKLSAKQLFKAIKMIQKGKTYIDDSIEEMLITGKFLKLSKREKQVLSELSKGYTQFQVAEALYVSPKTIESHLRNLKDRFETQNSMQLISMYIKYINGNKENYENTTPPFKKI